jgi:hypothetical protein
MPGGEQSTDAASHTKLFADTVGEFEWILVTRQDKNLPCNVCKPGKSGKPKGHGVDLLFRIQCTYTSHQRGIYVDGKRYAFSSVTSKEKIKDWLESARTSTRHLEQSQILFREKLELPEDLQIDTGIVAWDCFEGWDREIAYQRRDDVVFSGSDQPPISVLFLFKNHLDRLTTIANYKEKCSDLEFLYKTSKAFVWQPVLTPELLMSNWWPIRYKWKKQTHWETGLVAFDLEEAKSVRFSVPVLDSLGLTTHPEINVYLAGVTSSETSQYQTLLNATAKEYSLSVKLTCKALAVVEYKS